MNENTPINSGNRQNLAWVPLAIAASLVLGILIGSHFTPQKSNNLDRKLNNLLGVVSNEYVDDVNMDSLVELSIPEILANLDPHSTYFTAEDLKESNDELNGSFSGIGISFQVIEDTVNVIEVLSGGPSQKVGIMAGDKIVTVDGKSFVGEKFNYNYVREQLRGAEGSVVKLGIQRNNSPKLLVFTVKRGPVSVNSIDAAYMIEKNSGYVKVNQFGRNTYNEFITALSQLKTEGAKRYIVDLRGNGGGYMEMAILMANEFLPEGKLIVSTKGRYRRDESQVWSDGNGAYQDAEIVVLTDEFSASSSEIFAGAIQDNDRGLIVGGRSFGKGLVQKQFPLFDGSSIRLTVARYYTPSGRCIQKDYSGGLANYNDELLGRFSNGELFSRDSIKLDKSKIFHTVGGRIVYGGGGIIPDLFVPQDTTGMSSWYINVANAGLFQQYALKYVQAHRKALAEVKDYKQLLRTLNDNTALLNDFVQFCAKHGVPARWYYIEQSRSLTITNLKALIARNLLGQQAFYPILNRTDRTVEAALKALNKHQAAFPVTMGATSSK